MMKSSIQYRLILMVCMAWTGIPFLLAQIQYPGKPMGDFRRMKASEVIYLLPPVDPLEIDSRIQSKRSGGEAFNKSLKYALDRPLEISPRSQGAWINEGNYRIWRAHIISPGAFSLGLVFSEYRLENEVSIMMYDPGLERIRGAYTSRNNKSSGVLAVGHIPGDEVIVELQVPWHVENFGKLIIGSVSHAFLPAAVAGPYDGRFGLSQDCEIDINCVEGADWQTEKGSVVRINNLRINQYCTGVLLNNTAYNGDPLLLTAKHCIEIQEGAERSVFDFNYESPSCFGGDGSVEMSVSGADLLAVGDSLDFSLVRLTERPQERFDVYYAGWDLSVAVPPATTTIHHPEGDVKKISKDYNTPYKTHEPDDIPPYFSYLKYNSFWWIKQWDVGSTERGSSGSPLFNPGHQVIGVLSFGSAKCGDSIDYDTDNDRIIYSKAVNRDDYYTRMNVAWDYSKEADQSLKRWLDPLDRGYSELGGYQPTSVMPPLVQEGKDFRLYPNPAGNFLYVTGPDGLDGLADYRVYDLSGALHRAGNGTLPGTVGIDVSGLDPGVYLLFIQAGNRNEVLKFVVAP